MQQRKREAIDAPRRRLVKTDGASEYTAVSVSRLEKMRLDGSGPKFVRLGGRAVAYDLADLDVWIDAQQKLSSTNETKRKKKIGGALR
jgi:predicted DNA-binding transcriptional regulator AlpA